MKKYKVGIVGFGSIGKVHAYGYSTLPYYMDPAPLEGRITHVVCSRPETAERARRLVGADVASTDYRTVTENPDIDIVHICTPNHLHLAPLLSAMAAGKHIYCEKPIVDTLEEAEQVAAALPSYKGVSQMVFHHRFFPSTIRAKQLIEEGALGRILEFRGAYLHASHADPNLPMRWKASAAQGGGVIADLASHWLDLCEDMIGPFGSLSAATHSPYPTRRDPADPTKQIAVDAEDSVSMMIRLADRGTLGSLQVTKLANGTENEMTLEIYGTEGSLRFNGMDPHHVLFCDATAPTKPSGGRFGWTEINTGHRYESPHTEFPASKSNIGWVRGHTACLANFLAAVAKGEPTTPDLARGVEIQRLIATIRNSAKSGTWVDV